MRLIAAEPFAGVFPIAPTPFDDSVALRWGR